jgi:hypothetical protein
MAPFNRLKRYTDTDLKKYFFGYKNMTVFIRIHFEEYCQFLCVSMNAIETGT